MFSQVFNSVGKPISRQKKKKNVLRVESLQVLNANSLAFALRKAPNSQNSHDLTLGIWFHFSTGEYHFCWAIIQEIEWYFNLTYFYEYLSLITFHYTKISEIE